MPEEALSLNEPEWALWALKKAFNTSLKNKFPEMELTV